MLPSFVALEYFNHGLNPGHVRLDHIFINRAVNEANEVIGTHMAGHKIGGDIEGAMVLFPDPMGATGGQEPVKAVSATGRPVHKPPA